MTASVCLEKMLLKNNPIFLKKNIYQTFQMCLSLDLNVTVETFLCVIIVK